MQYAYGKRVPKTVSRGEVVMKALFSIAGFSSYILIVFLNAMTDLGHKIILQNTIFKAYEGSELIVLTAIVNALILLPFIFLFSPAGYISDKYPKTKVFILCWRLRPKYICIQRSKYRKHFNFCYKISKGKSLLFVC